MALTKKNLMPSPQEEECEDGGMYKPMMRDGSSQKPQLMASTMQANPLSYKPKRKKKPTADSIWAKGFASRPSK
jgi:hypothetical protein